MRFFYLYGNDQPQRSLYGMLKEAVKNKEIEFNISGGKQLRDYLHIDEANKKIVKLINIKSDLGIINICSGKPISVIDLVEYWKLKYNWNIKLNLGYYPYSKLEPMEFWGSNEKYKKTIKLK